MTNQNYTYLVNNGPSTPRELPTGASGVTRAARRDGLKRFRLSSGNGAHKSGIGQYQTTIYYIEGKHSRLSVVRAWRDANPSSVENLSRRSLHQKIASNYPEFKDASYEVFGPMPSYAENGGGTGVSDNDCPFCGNEMDRFPDHVDDCPSL